MNVYININNFNEYNLKYKQQNSMKSYVLKFSSEECGTCHRMSHYDSAVVSQLGCEFIDIPMQDTSIYSKYRKILLAKYPKKEGMGWPTYLVVNDPTGEFSIVGEIKGDMSKGEFRESLSKIVETN